MNKRERVLTALELGEPDKIPTFFSGFEKTATAYAEFIASDIYNRLYTAIDGIGDITEQRFFDTDCWVMDPFNKIKNKTIPSPPEFHDYRLSITGTLKKHIKMPQSVKPFYWYTGPYFTKKELLLESWEKYGKPSERMDDTTNYSPKIWEKYCNALQNYFHPMGSLEYAIAESLIEGMGFDRFAYYTRKDPQFIHFVINEYSDANIETIKRLNEAGVEIVFYYDDLAQKGRTIFSRQQFEDFLLPAYKKLYATAKKYGMLVIHHSCGYVTPFIPDLIDAGLNGLQSLEPAAGIDLAQIKNEFGSKICLIGGLDSTQTLNFGTKEEIIENVKNCIRDAGKNGGYIIGPAHNILNAPLENVEAMVYAINKFRTI
jgi:hypothetical protein